ncbi:MAG: hypothetical protein GWN84_14690 [Gammaproteobacteria bacterium]|nr:hypothetical protein [Gammaproteobacteria bacterium]NIR84047.1 hypothetical protein [Gammaproteobacteria bacterium]NIR89191.1 hypothetical protein [Gammaproteobacteria bacterium]NIU04993.1 hypothetical protein [Gammaproteobacteria bacterium]NIV52159.1 hypothetical protein [Gammaproteobacteria bacterium]
MGVADSIPNGTVRTVDGRECVFYDGYWIRYYAPPQNTLTAKKKLIDSLTRRLFHHTEPGINTPGERLDVARRAYKADADPETKRVKGAMLAGALFNRAADMFTAIVELEEKGVRLKPDNELMKQCEEYFQEALELGRMVKHYSGHEGIDELWGEPLKAFAMPIRDFYDSRYVKIAQTMRDIDRIADRLQELFRDDPVFAGLSERIDEFAQAAKLESETMRSDPDIFEIWPRFVATGERLLAFQPKLPPNASQARVHHVAEGVRIIRDGKDLLTYLAGARVPMPKSTQQFFQKCGEYERAHGSLFDRRRSRRA